MTKTLLILILLCVTFKVIDLPVATAKNIKPATTLTFTLETLTVYNPTSSQTDSDPLITASNAEIKLPKLRTGKLRWMALSRDMLKRWGGKIKYGDTVLVTSGDSSIDGYWVVHDTMNKRYKKRGDLLFHEAVRTKGKWRNVKITKKL